MAAVLPGLAAVTAAAAAGRSLLPPQQTSSSAAHCWRRLRLPYHSTRQANQCLLKASSQHPVGEGCGDGAVQGSSDLKPVSSQPPSGGGGGATAKVAAFTGAYITAFGAAVLAFPKQLFALLFPASVLSAGWIRVGATLALLFGAYYLGAALDDKEGRKPLRMYQATVLGRGLLALLFCGLVAGGQCGAGLLLLAATNAVGAWRMAAALQSDGITWAL